MPQCCSRGNVADGRDKMKRNRLGDNIGRLIIKTRLQGISCQEIARTSSRNRDNIVRDLAGCGRVVGGAYHLNALMAKALFTEQELTELDARWNGRCWVGHARRRGVPAGEVRRSTP